MKKTVFVLTLLACISSVSAGTCFDLSVNLSRGNESSSVLSLQNFLAQKGYLKPKPNGYFGPATTLAAKAYQKSVGIIETGAVYTLTRAAIKKETCGESVIKTTTSGIPQIPLVTQPIATSTIVTNVQTPIIVPVEQNVTLPVPVISSINLATFISGGHMTSPLTINGLNFSTSSNTVMVKLQGSARVYTLGTFAMTGTTTIIVPSSFTFESIPCGNGCSEKLPAGNYDVIVKTGGGESNTGYMSLKTIVSSSSSGSQGIALPQKATQVRLGTVTFSSSVTVSLESFIVSIVGNPSFNTAAITGITLKDEAASLTLGNASPYNLGQEMFVENQSKIYGIYANINSDFGGVVSVNTTLEVKDYIAKNVIQVLIPSFLVSISG